MTSDVTRRLRQARFTDADRLADVEIASWRHAYTGILPDAFLDRRLERSARMARWLTALLNTGSSSERTWVIELGGVLVGYAQTGRCRDRDATRSTAELHTIYLLPEAWGIGAGYALLQMAVVDLQSRGASALTLWVLQANTRARRFYQRCGFTPDGARKTELWDGVRMPQLRYRLDLR